MRARAIVLDTGAERAALVQVDLGGIPYALVQRVYELIPETGIPLENIMIAATHTHSSTGPIWPVDSTGYALLGGDAFDPRVFEFTAQGIARAIVAGQLVPRPGEARHREDAAHERLAQPQLRAVQAQRGRAEGRGRARRRPRSTR